MGAVRSKGSTLAAPVRHWQDQALCRRSGIDPNRWFEIPGGTLANQRYKLRAELEICQACDVLEECAEYGERELFGIWGGLLPRERREKKR